MPRQSIAKALEGPNPITAGMDLDTAIARLDALCKRQPETSKVLEIGPELAEHILSTRNVSNRPMKPGKLKEYAADLAAGRWGLTGDTIKFGTDGTLKDGQNRLAAVVRSRVPIRTHAVFGVNPDLFTRMDTGKVRTPADVFHIAGLHYANHAAATVRWLMILTGDNPANRSAHFTNEELLAAYRQRFDPLQVEHSVRMALEVKKATGAPVGSTAALHYLFSQEDGRDVADRFMLEWANGSGGARSPTKVLQRKLTDMAVATNNRIHESVRNALIVQAYLAFRDNRTITRSDLDWTPGEDAFPGIRKGAEPEAEPEKPAKAAKGKRRSKRGAPRRPTRKDGADNAAVLH